MAEESKKVSFMDLRLMPSYADEFGYLYQHDHNILLYYDVVRPITKVDCDAILNSQHGKYFYLHEEGNIKTCIGIAGFIEWRENRGGAELFLSMKQGYQQLFEKAIKALVQWYFNNFTRPVLYMQRISGDPNNKILEKLNPEHRSGKLLYFAQKFHETELYIFYKKNSED